MVFEPRSLDARTAARLANMAETTPVPLAVLKPGSARAEWAGPAPAKTRRRQLKPRDKPAPVWSTAVEQAVVTVDKKWAVKVAGARASTFAPADGAKPDSMTDLVTKEVLAGRLLPPSTIAQQRFFDSDGTHAMIRWPIAPSGSPERHLPPGVHERARSCTLSGDGLHGAAAGEVGTVAVRVERLVASRQPPERWPKLTLELRPVGASIDSAGLPAVSEASASVLLPAAQVNLRYGPVRRSGPHLLHIKLDGAHCTGSPVLLNIRPARAVAGKSRFAETSTAAHAGRPFCFRLLLHDCFGNRACVGQADVRVEIRRVMGCEAPRLPELVSEQGRHWSRFNCEEACSAPAQSAMQTVRCTVRGGEGGIAECNAVCLLAGEWVATAAIDGAESPQHLCVAVAPASPDARFSVLRALHAGARLEAVAGEPHALAFVPRDAHGCDCPPDKSWRAVLVRVDGFGAGRGRGADPYAPVTLEPGTGGASAEMNFLAQRAGVYQLRMARALAGQTVETICYSIRVCPSARDAEGFELLGSGLASAVAGEVAHVVVRPRSFGAAAELARETFASLAAALEVRASIDGRIHSVQLTKRRQAAGGGAATRPVEVVSGHRGPGGHTCPEDTHVGDSVGLARSGAAIPHGYTGSDGGTGLLSLQPDGPREEDAGREEWHLQYTCSKSGPAVLRVTLGGTPVGGAPISMRIISGPVFSPSCGVGGLVNEWVVGKWLVLQLTLRDRLGNPRESGGNRIVLRLVRLAESAQTWREGSALVVTDAAGQAPDGRPDAERVSAAAAMGGRDASEGREALAEAAARAITEDTADGSLGGEGGCEGGCERGRPLHTRTELEAGWGSPAEFTASEVVAIDHGNGKVELRALVYRAGLYAVRVAVDGAPVPLSHGRVAFLPEQADSRRCELGGEAATGQVPTNRYAPLLVTLRDCFGNLAYRASWEGASPRLEMSLLQGSAQLLPLRPVASDCVPRQKGHFQARVKPLIPGPLVLGVYVDGEAVGGEPLRILAHTGPTVARQCFCSGSGWAKVVPAGTKLAFIVHACDAAGHAQTTGTDSFAVVLAPRAHGQHFRGKPKQLTGRRLDASQALFEMGPLPRGPYVISVCMRGKHVRGSPLHFEVEDRSNGRPSQKPWMARSSMNRNLALLKGQGY